MARPSFDWKEFFREWSAGGIQLLEEWQQAMVLILGSRGDHQGIL